MHTASDTNPPPVLSPSQTAEPTRSDTEPQQASTQPGDGSQAHAETGQQSKIPWKDQVLGYAKLTRGKVLGKQKTAEVGHKILQGEIAPTETRKAKKQSQGDSACD